MPYTQFTTIAKAKQAFDLTVQEGDRFIPPLSPIAPSEILSGTLKDSLPIVATSGSEKARSEGIIYPVLLEVRRILDRKISLFSGEDFTIDEAVGLNGVFDFLLARSSEVLEIEAPAVVKPNCDDRLIRLSSAPCGANPQLFRLDDAEWCR
jgi:hypothetical protein